MRRLRIMAKVMVVVKKQGTASADDRRRSVSLRRRQQAMSRRRTRVLHETAMSAALSGVLTQNSTAPLP